MPGQTYRISYSRMKSFRKLQMQLDVFSKQKSRCFSRQATGGAVISMFNLFSKSKKVDPASRAQALPTADEH